MLVTNGKISISSVWILMLYVTKSLIDYPQFLLEKLLFQGKIEKTKVTFDPIFIIGHYRSGTTFLHRLMVTHPELSSFTIMNQFFPYWPLWLQELSTPFLNLLIRIFRIRHILFNQYDLKLNDPVEEEMYLISILSTYSGYWSYVFPLNADKYFNRYLIFLETEKKIKWQKAYLECLKKLSWLNPNKRLLLKNPLNMGRVGAILELFPNAKFIFLHRNPIEVYYSMEQLWRKIIEKYYSVQRINSDEREKILLNHYKTLNDLYLRDRELIPKQNLVEVSYKTFCDRPIEFLKEVVTKFGLNNDKAILKSIELKISEESLYKKNVYQYDVKKINQIKKELRKYYEAFGF